MLPCIIVLGLEQRMSLVMTFQYDWSCQFIIRRTRFQARLSIPAIYFACLAYNVRGHQSCEKCVMKASENVKNAVKFFNLFFIWLTLQVTQLNFYNFVDFINLSFSLQIWHLFQLTKILDYTFVFICGILY